MNLYAPDYYPLFRCVADKCRHTCCTGWEIDIDEESLKKYEALGDGRLLRAISREDTPHFITDERGRCPMLTENNLCSLITAYGEDILCDICRDHPRFRNFWSCRTEIGLGLVCEEAARIILTRQTPMKFILLSGSGREKPNRAEKYLLQKRGLLLAGIRAQGPKARLIEYLAYRHLADALYDDDLEARVAMVRRAYRTITGAWDDGTMETLIENCRVFSDTVEYDSDNLAAFKREAVLKEGLSRLTFSDLE